MNGQEERATGSGSRSLSIDRRAEASHYQQAILEWIDVGGGDAIVEAVAGSGKTTTLEMAWQQVQESHGEQRAIFLAFNKTVAMELRARLPGMAARTLHSLGYQPTRAWIGQGQPDVNDNKYVELVRASLARYANESDKGNRFLAEDLKKVIDLGRFTLIDMRDIGALQDIVTHHNIGRGFGRVGRYLHLLGDICDDGIAEARNDARIDFADQLWLPYVVDAPLETFDWIFVDESQDLNAAQIELVLRSRAHRGRIIFVGDANQAIYGFAGADSMAMARIATRTGAVRLPLSITYRCARSHVAVARNIVPHLEARPGAPEGVFAELSIERAMAMMSAGDLVLSRETAPVVQLQRHLDDHSRDAFVDDETKWKRLKSLLATYRKTGVVAKAVLDTIEDDVRRSELGTSTALEKFERLDNLKALVSCLHERPATSYADLESHIDRVFVPRAHAVRCMTIHKAKGLEADRVFLIRPDLLPHRYAMLPWQKDQEENLLYVALTRAKTELYVCHGEIAYRYLGDDARSLGASHDRPLGSGQLGTGWNALGGKPQKDPGLYRPGSRYPVSVPVPRTVARVVRAASVRLPEDRLYLGLDGALSARIISNNVEVQSVTLEGEIWSVREHGISIPSGLFEDLIRATSKCVQVFNSSAVPKRVDGTIGQVGARLERLGAGTHGYVRWSAHGSDGARLGAVTLPRFGVDDLIAWLDCEL